MKKLLFIAFASIMIVSCKKETVEPITPVVIIEDQPVIEMYVMVNGCETTITDNITYQCVQGIYTITANNSIDDISIKFKDLNNDQIEFNDTLQFNYVMYTICNTQYSLQTSHYATVSIIDNVTIIEYFDCLIPLNGATGSIRIKIKR